MSDRNNLPELGKKLIDLEKALEKFQIAHTAFHCILRDEDDILESNDYYDTVMEGIRFPIWNKRPYIGNNAVFKSTYDRNIPWVMQGREPIRR